MNVLQTRQSLPAVLCTFKSKKRSLNQLNIQRKPNFSTPAFTQRQKISSVAYWLEPRTLSQGENAAESSINQSLTSQPSPRLVESSSRYPRTSSIVFIDSAVPDYPKLIAGAQADEVVVLDPRRNGVVQIGETLSRHRHLSSIHIVSHGTPAALYLGTAQLSAETIDAYASTIRGWAQALSPEAEILVYGCQVAAGKGKAFIRQLSQLTGAAIAASKNLTGCAALGGDWLLEETTGTVESALAFSPQTMQTYSAVLDIRYEAESMDLTTFYVDQSTFESASGGKLITLSRDNQDLSGTANFTFDGAPGIYEVVIAYYDENDGVSQLEVEQDDTVLDTWTLDEATDGAAPSAKTYRTRTIASQLSVEEGDSFSITGTRFTDEYSDEWIRLDYLEFIPVTDPSPSTLALSSNAYTVNEDDETVEITVLRNGSQEGTISVDYTTSNNSATADDYTATSGTVVFESGETSQTIVVPIVDDSDSEGTESFNFVIDNFEGDGSIGAPRTAQITIVDDDAAADAVLITEAGGDTTVVEGGASNSYSVELTQQPSDDVVVEIAPDEELTTDFATLTFTPDSWDEPQTVTVNAVQDSDQEGKHSGTISHTVSSSDPAFDGFSLRDVEVNIVENNTGSFGQETVVSGLSDPTAFDCTPDGQMMFVAQQNGVVSIVEDGTLADPFVDISDQVNYVRDRGLLGLAVHPDFPNAPYVYLAFTYDPPEADENTGLAGPDGKGNRPSRVIRVTADASTDYKTAVPGSEVVLLGTNSTWENISAPDGNSTFNLSLPPSGINDDGSNVQDYLATDSESHGIGALKFGTDGSLFVSNGDGTSYNKVDPRTVRVQDIDNLSGKLLRIDPLTGEGLSDNPFYNGDPDSNRSKVYSYGLRNPFRFTIDPITGEPFIGDVGWKSWEEINTGEGANFGWPYYEGGNGTSLVQSGYADLPEAQEFYDSGESVTPAVYARSHSDGAVAIIMGDFYTGTTYPDRYDGALFFNDYGEQAIRYLTFDESGDVESVETFKTGVSGIVQLSTGPDGNLYYADRISNEIGYFEFIPEAA